MKLLKLAILASTLAAPQMTQAQAATGSSKIDDAVIVGIFDAANAWDIATGALVASRSANKEVKEYGAMLVVAHKSVQQQGRDLAKKLGVVPTPVPADFALKRSHEQAMSTLSRLRGAEFDRAFLQHEIAFHAAVIEAVTTTFLPTIQSAELKAFVEKVAPAFQAHLLQAENLLEKAK